MADDAVLHLVDPDQAAELVRLVGLALADDLAVRLEQAEDLALHVDIAAEHALLGLKDDLAYQREKVLELQLLSQRAQPFADDRRLAGCLLSEARWSPVGPRLGRGRRACRSSPAAARGRTLESSAPRDGSRGRAAAPPGRDPRPSALRPCTPPQSASTSASGRARHRRAACCPSGGGCSSPRPSYPSAVSGRGYPLGASHGHDAGVDRLRRLGSQKGEGPAERGEVGSRVTVEVREQAVGEIRPDLSFQLPKRPSLQVLQHAAPKQPIRRDAASSRPRRAWVSRGEAGAHEVHETLVVQQGVDRLEEVVLDERHLCREGREE